MEGDPWLHDGREKERQGDALHRPLVAVHGQLLQNGALLVWTTCAWCAARCLPRQWIDGGLRHSLMDLMRSHVARINPIDGRTGGLRFHVNMGALAHSRGSPLHTGVGMCVAKPPPFEKCCNRQRMSPVRVTQRCDAAQPRSNCDLVRKLDPGQNSFELEEFAT